MPDILRAILRTIIVPSQDSSLPRDRHGAEQPRRRIVARGLEGIQEEADGTLHGASRT